MSTQLQELAKRQVRIHIGRREFTLEGVSSREVDSVATLCGPRAKYQAFLCPKVRVIGRPGAEVWTVLSSSGRRVLDFAVHEGRVVEIQA